MLVPDDDGETPPDPWDRDLGEIIFDPDIDYIEPWQEAREAAEDLHIAINGLKVPGARFEAKGATGPGGEGLVRVTMSPLMARFFTAVTGRVDWSSMPPPPGHRSMAK